MDTNFFLFKHTHIREQVKKNIIFKTFVWSHLKDHQKMSTKFQYVGNSDSFEMIEQIWKGMSQMTTWERPNIVKSLSGLCWITQNFSRTQC